MPSRSLEDACSILREAVPQIIDKWSSRYSTFGLSAAVGEVLRTTEDQKATYARGRSMPGKIVTNRDGVSSISNHQSQEIHGETCSHAVDINVFGDEGKRYLGGEGDAHWYYALIGLSICQGVQSGGDWAHPDFPHLYCPFAKE